MSLPFVKMHGLGNDFVIVLTDAAPFDPDPDHVRAIADRSTGLGCDQLIAVTRSSRAHAGMKIWNADGGEVEACGNATRCVGWLLTESMAVDVARIETSAGILEARRVGQRMITIDMGPPGLAWRDIPLATEMGTREIFADLEPALGRPGCVSMGNPHVVFFVPDVETVQVQTVGPRVEHHPLFPERVNVGFAEVVGPRHIRFKVWERGVGQTRACGTGACAALVAAHRRGFCDRAAVVQLDGGELSIQWREADDHVLMTGPVALEFTGRLPVPEMAA